MDQHGALLLAAAAGSGFGGAMALARWGTDTLIDHLAAVARRAGAESVVVVIGPESEAVLSSLRTDDLIVVLNDDHEEGNASSLRAGLDTLWRLPDIEAVAVMDIEEPAVSERAVAAVLEHERTTGRPMAVPKYRYARGLPVAIDRQLWPRLMGLEGSIDLVDLAAAHPDWVEEVHLDMNRPTRVKTLEDLEAQRRRRPLA